MAQASKLLLSTAVLVILDGSEQRANARWINNGGPVDDFWRSQRTPQVD